MSIEKALDKIADVLTNTTDDANGSIEYSLSVIADALENGGGTGGGGTYYIEPDEDEPTKINASYNDIVGAINSDMIVAMKAPSMGSTIIAYASLYDVIEGKYRVGFTAQGATMFVVSTDADAHMELSNE